MAGDVIIHRAYFGGAEAVDGLHSRLYRLERSLRDLQERAEPVSGDPWEGEGVERVTVAKDWHGAAMEAYHATILREMGLYLDTRLRADRDEVMDRLRELTPTACTPPF